MNTCYILNITLDIRPPDTPCYSWTLHKNALEGMLEDVGVMSPYLAYISSYSPPIPSIPACHESPIYILHFIHEQLSLNLTS